MIGKTRWIILGIVLTPLVFLAVATAWAGPLAQGEVETQAALGTTFTYQGRLNKNGQPVSDDCEMAFRLYDQETIGNQVGSAITTTATISNSVFTVKLNFGSGVFTGTTRWLGIKAKCPGDTAFADLGRQELTAASYALYALGSPWSGLTGVPATSGDITGTYPALTVTGLQGRPISTTVPGIGQILEWDGSAWTPTITGGNYSAGLGLVLSGTEFSVVTSSVQTRVSGACTVSNTIRAINADGTVVCEADDDTTYAAGNQLSLSSNTFDVVEGSGSGLDADLLDGQHASNFAGASHGHYSLDAADGSPTNVVSVNNDGGVEINTTTTMRVGQSDVGQPSVLVSGQVDRDPTNTSNIPQFSTYLYGGPPGTTARYGMGHYYGLALSAYENDLGDPHWGIIKFYTGGDGLSMAEQMRIDYAGNVGIGTTNPQSKLQVDGYIQLDTVAGAPPAADCNEASEEGRMIFDPNSDVLYICSGVSGWVSK